MTKRCLNTVLALGCLLALGAASAQQSATVGGPPIVKAGESINFTIELDQPPNFLGCELVVNAEDESHLFGAGSHAVHLDLTHTSYVATIAIPLAAPGGTYHANAQYYCPGMSGWSRLQRSDTVFQTIPTKGLIFPTSATVGISESQSQLLRREVTRLQSAIQDLKGAIEAAGGDPRLTAILVSGIVGQEAQLQKTQEEFTHAAPNDKQQGDSQIFFADIRSLYDDALSELHLPSGRLSHEATFTPATLERKPEAAPLTFPGLAQGTLRAFEHNELAFTTVANAESLTFDLQVESEPPGASVEYKRHGDNFENAPDKTTTTLKSLPYAIWVIRVEAPGLRAQEREHDPFTEPNHVLYFQLKP